MREFYAIESLSSRYILALNKVLYKKRVRVDVIDTWVDFINPLAQSANALGARSLAQKMLFSFTNKIALNFNSIHN